MQKPTDMPDSRVESLPQGFARYRMVMGDDGLSADFVLSEFNPAFAAMTGRDREDILGQKASEVLPGLEEGLCAWRGDRDTGERRDDTYTFQHYAEPVQRWHDVTVYSDEPGFCTTVCHEITSQKEELVTMRTLLAAVEKLLASDPAAFDFQQPVEAVRELSGALYAAINTYEDEGTRSVTRAMAGIPSSIRRASDLLGFEIIGRSWDIIPERIRQIQGGKLVRYQGLYESSLGAVGKAQASLLEKMFRIGSIYVIELAYGGGDTLGDIIIFMPRGQEIRNREAIELYAGQLGSLLGRMRAEAELRRSETKYRSLADNLPGVAFRCLYDRNWTMLYMSADIDKITGYPSAEFLDNEVRSYESVISPEDRLHVAQEVAAAVKAQSPWDIEYRVMHRDGTIRWVQERGRAFLDRRGGVEFLDGFILDASERKKAEAEREAAADELRRLSGQQDILLNHTDVLIWYLEDAMTTGAVNQALARFYGQPLHKLERQNLHTFMMPEEVLIAVEANKRVISEKKTIKNEEWVQNGSGQGRLLEITRTPCLSSQGQVEYVVCSALDVTREKQLQRELEEREKRLAAIHNATNHISFIVTGVDPDCPRILEFSPGAEAIFGYHKEEIMGRSVSILHLREDAARFPEVIARLKREPQGNSTEMRLVRKSGEEFPALVTLYPLLDASGDMWATLGVSLDITEQKQAEEQRELQISFLQIAAEASAVLVSGADAGDFDRAVDQALQGLGELFGFDRSYLFQFSEDLEQMSNTHEWCRSGVAAQKDRIQNQPTADLPWWKAMILSREPLTIDDVSALPSSAEAERQEFTAQGIRSLVCLPTVGARGRLTGFIGFDMVRQNYSWTPEQVTMLQLVADIIGGALERRRAMEGLQIANANMATVLDSTFFGVVIIDKERTIRWANPVACRLAGVEGPEGLIGCQCGDYLCPADQNECPILDQGQDVDNSERILRRSDGTIIPILKTVTEVNLEGEDVLLETFIDITERKRAEEALRDRLAFQQLLSDISYRFINLPAERMDKGIVYALESVGKFFETDRSYLIMFKQDGLTYDCTHEWCAPGVPSQQKRNTDFPVELTPWWFNELRSGRHVYIDDVEKMPPEAARDREDFLVEGIRSILAFPLKRENEVVGCLGFDAVKEKIEMSEDQVNLLQLVADLIASALTQHQAYQQVRYLSFHDQLTGLYNRHYLVNELERMEGSREYPIAIMTADLDCLKLVNDTLGHRLGDLWLQECASILKGNLRKADILARMGGDEFALLLPRTDREAAEKLMCRIRQSIDEYNQSPSYLPISLSLGLGVCDGQSFSLTETYHEADNLMYQEKLERSKEAKERIIEAMLVHRAEREGLVSGEYGRIQELCYRLGLAAGMDETQVADLVLLSRVYELGMAIPEEYRGNQDVIAPRAEQIIHQHVERGYRIARNTPELAEIAGRILYHHENYDGSGYPRGLSGTDIPLDCRILAIAGAYHAMITSRPFHQALSEGEARAEIRRLSGTRFDPALVELFLEMLNRQ